MSHSLIITFSYKRLIILLCSGCGGERIISCESLGWGPKLSFSNLHACNLTVNMIKTKNETKQKNLYTTWMLCYL